jgi:hypothetical protein
LANKIDATTTATHREVEGVATAQRVRRCSARSTLLGAFGAARRIRRCSALLDAARRVRRCSARSALLGAFDAVRHVRRC